MKKSGFTLIELLVVITIIIVLIGLTSAGVSAAIKKAKIQRASTEVMNVLSAVNLYKSEIGFFPSAINENHLGKNLSKQDVYNATGQTDKIFGPYFEFKDSNTDTANPRNLVDPWGNSYIYIKANDTSNGSIPGGGSSNAYRAVDNGFSIVFSYGPDGTTATSDDIGSWQ